MSQLGDLSSFAPGHPVTKPVYHYTTPAGLLNMIKSGTVWASEASSLNDLAEVRQGWDAVHRLLEKMPTSNTQERLLDYATQPLEARHEVFILSASTAGDDANQWRLYADRGRGYVVGLDGRVQLAVISTVPAPPRPKAELGKISFHSLGDSAAVTPWQRVLYSDRQIQAVLDRLVATIEAERKEYLEKAEDEDAYDEHSSRIRDESYSALAAVAHLIKSPGFSGENEVRVVVTLPFGHQHIRYRATNVGIVGYLALTSAPRGKRRPQVLRPTKEHAAPTHLPVRSITTGPLLSDEHANTLRGFLGSLDAERVKVLHSEVPLR